MNIRIVSAGSAIDRTISPGDNLRTIARSVQPSGNFSILVNGEEIPAGQWDAFTLRDRDTVLISPTGVKGGA